MTTAPPRWRKSSHSQSNGHCVEVDAQPGAFRKSSRCDAGACAEVAACSDGVLVRDSMMAPAAGREGPEGPHLTFTPGAWREFTERVKAEVGVIS